jgi:regulator of RNase E activity RraA/CMP-N-acetylneuraminic acid synthetase
MTAPLRIVAFVPAKGQSERIANKNMQVLDGDYLFRRKLCQLANSRYLSHVYLDTESDLIAMEAEELPVTRLKRPEGLATNATDGHEMFAWEASAVPLADIYIQILCTAPFVTADTVDRAIEALLADPEADSLVAVSSSKQYRWEAGSPAYGSDRIPNSIDLPATVVEAMSLYLVRRRPGEGPPSRRFGCKPILFELTPIEQIDVNNPIDLDLAETICAGQRASDNGRLRSMRSFLSSPILADISKEMGLATVLPRAIRATSPGKLLGRAKTLSLRALDAGQRRTDAWKGIYGALDSYRFLRPNDVIMVSNSSPEHAYFGDLNANLAIRSGAAGAIIDGVTRDTSDVRALGLPVYARGSYCDDIKYEGTMAAMNGAIEIGDVPISNNDMVFADEDGVVVIPQLRWADVERAAWDVLSNEHRIRLSAAMGRDVNEILAECGTF